MSATRVERGGDAALSQRTPTFHRAVDDPVVQRLRQTKRSRRAEEMAPTLCGSVTWSSKTTSPCVGKSSDRTRGERRGPRRDARLDRVRHERRSKFLSRAVWPVSAPLRKGPPLLHTIDRVGRARMRRICRGPLFLRTARADENRRSRRSVGPTFRRENRGGWAGAAAESAGPVGGLGDMAVLQRGRPFALQTL